MVPPPNPLLNSTIPNNQTENQINFTLSKQAQPLQNIPIANTNQVPVFNNQHHQMAHPNPNKNQTQEVLNSNNSPFKQNVANTNGYQPYPQYAQPQVQYINNQGNATVAIRHAQTFLENDKGDQFQDLLRVHAIFAAFAEY